MKQQINLYQGAVRREQPAFGALPMVASIALCAVALAGGWYYASGHARDMGATLASIQQQEAAAAKRLDALTQTLATYRNDDSASESLREALDALARRERLLALIDGPELGETTGFSEPLRALARHGLEGLWLTRILVSAPAMHTTLEGRAQTAHLVPEYLLGLSAESALSGQRFDQFKIDGDDETAGSTLRFSMTSAPAERFAARSETP